MSTNQQLIELEYYDASILNEILGRNISVFDNHFLLFTHEELASITSITLTGVESLKFLTKLPNLQVLHIVSLNYKVVSDKAGMYDSKYFNTIQAQELNEVLKKLPKLKELYINNDLTINRLDLSHNPLLEVLHLENNPELNELVGLGTLHKLKRVVMFGNNITTFDDFLDYVKNTLDAEENKIDISALFAFFNRFKEVKTKDKFLEYLGKLDFQGLLNVQFTEKNGIVGYNSISFGRLKHLIKNYVSLFKKYNIFQKTDIEKVDYVLRYIKNNVAFAKEGLQEREQFIRLYGDEKGNVPDWGDKYISHLHSSFSTFNLKSGNCEGIVNLMRIMLYILGIESENVQCNDKRSKVSSQNNHALIRIKLNDTWYYFDPAYDKTSPGNYSYMTYDEIEKYLNLPLYEKLKAKGVDISEKTDIHLGYNQ